MDLQTKLRSVSILVVAELAAISLWFVSAAILPEMVREAAIPPGRQAALSSAVQLGFVAGALVSAILGLPDRFDPRRLFAVSALAAAAANALLLAVPLGGDIAIAARFATGALLAGVYPVGMKIAVGWGQRDRGLLVGTLVGALTLGSAAPHLVSLAGGADWRLTVTIASAAAATAGLLVLLVGLGPHHARAPAFDPRAITQAWTNRRVRLAYAGYLGHMWELYAMWAWIAAATAVSYGATMPTADAQSFAKLTAFLSIAAGGIASVAAGLVGDRIGKAVTAAVALAISGTSALLVATTFGGPPWLTFVLVLVWGASIVPDSGQFSALVADAAPPQIAGSLMTFQTALGFLLTFGTVQLVPLAAGALGWPTVLASLAIGPAIGIVAMLRLHRL
jgi:MFS family permease